MALTALTIDVANLAKPEARQPVEFLDSGTAYSFVPREVLSRLGIAPHSRQRFQIGDRTSVMRERGDALYLYNGQAGAAPVIFGEPGDATLLGNVTLAALGLVFDPIRRVLLPLPMIVGGVPRARRELL